MVTNQAGRTETVAPRPFQILQRSNSFLSGPLNKASVAQYKVGVAYTCPTPSLQPITKHISPLFARTVAVLPLPADVQGTGFL